MKISGVRKVRIAITISLLLLFLFANIYVIRQLMYYGLQLYFYDKMLVAFQIGGSSGLNKELASVLSQEKTPRETALAKSFKKNLNTFKTPDKFLKDTTEELKRKINFFRTSRNIAFVLIMVILLLRLTLNFFTKTKK